MQYKTMEKIGVAVLLLLAYSSLIKGQQELYDNSKTEYTTNKTKIYLAAFFLNVEKDTYTYRAGMEVARRLINNDDLILKDYEIVVHYHNSLNSWPTIRALYKFLESGPVKQVLLGPAFSTVNKKIIPFVTNIAIPQVSFSARKRFNERREVNGRLVPTPLEKKKYPYLVRTTPSFVQNNYARVRMIQNLGWKRVAIVFDNGHENFEKVEDLTEQLKQANIDIVATERFEPEGSYEDFDALFDNLNKSDARIIIGYFLDDKGAWALMCEAYHRGIYGERYTWFVSEAVTNILGTRKFQNVNVNRTCDYTDVYEAMDKSIFTSTVDLRQDDVKSVANLNTTNIWQKIANEDRKHMFEHNMKHPHDPVFPFNRPNLGGARAYDAVYTAALALDRLIKKRGNATLLTKYGDRKKALEITRELFNSDFEGITGLVKFGGPTNDDVLGHVTISQWESKLPLPFSTLTQIGYFNPSQNQIDVRKINDTIFTDNKKRLDGIQTIPKELYISRYSLYIIWMLIGVSIIMALVFLTINMKYRTVRLIKMSSPNMNSGIVFGCLLLYVTLILYGLDTRFISRNKLLSLCYVFPFLMSIGFTFVFGCLFSKTWRVYKIFTAAPKMVKVNTAALRDERLYVLVLCLVLVDLFISIIWVVVSPFELENVVTASRALNVDYREEDFYHKCSCQYSTHFSTTMFAYKGALLILGSFLAWETRHVRVAALNDSKFIGMAVYNVFIVSTTTLIVYYAISDFKTYYYQAYVIVSAAILICSNITVILVFVPKILLLFGHNKTLARALSVQTFSFSSGGSTNHLNSHGGSTNQINSQGLSTNRMSVRNGSTNKIHHTDSSSSVVYNRYADEKK